MIMHEEERKKGTYLFFIYLPFSLTVPKTGPVIWTFISITKMTKSRKMRWQEHVARMGRR